METKRPGFQSAEVPDFYTCAVCLNHLRNLKPRLLSCHHYFCEKCLITLLKQNKISCPTCRKTTDVDNGDVTKLSMHFLLLQFMERDQQMNKENLRDGRKGHCQLCCEEIGINKCKDCNKILCERCTAKHNKMKNFNEHVVMRLCYKHLDGVSHFCMQCIDALCLQCVFDHEDHENQVEKYEDGISKLESGFKILEDDLNKQITTIEQDQNERNGTLLKIQETRKDLQMKRASLEMKIKDIDVEINELDKTENNNNCRMKYDEDRRVECVNMSKNVIKLMHALSDDEKIRGFKGLKTCARRKELSSMVENSLRSIQRKDAEIEHAVCKERPPLDDKNIHFTKNLLENKDKLKQLLGKESELLLACLASKGVLNKSQTDRLLMCANADQRMEDLFKIMLTLPNRDTFEVFVSVLEENGDNVAADILRRDRSRPKLQLKEEDAEDALPLQELEFLETKHGFRKEKRQFSQVRNVKLGGSGPKGATLPQLWKSRFANLDLPGEDIEFTVGSMVEVEQDGIVKTGVIRWIGVHRDEPTAGLEMDEEVTTGDLESRSGRLEGMKVFKCERGRGLFVPLKECKPDQRFCPPKEIRQ